MGSTYDNAYGMSSLLLPICYPNQPLPTKQNQQQQQQKRLEQPIQTDPSPGHWPPPRAFSPILWGKKKPLYQIITENYYDSRASVLGLTHTHKRNRRDTARYYYQTMSPRVQSVIELTGAVTFR